MKAFGVGCIHFAIKDEIEKKYITSEEYINEVKKLLESISTVSDIYIDYNEEIKNAQFPIDKENPRLQDGDFCFPYIDMYQLEFKIYIPYRIQSQLINLEEEFLDTYTENFKIYIRHNWHGPLSIIECLNPTTDTHPSTAVRIIREYLNNEINKSDTILIHDFIGPSPFHADFYLNILEDEDKYENAIEFEHIKTSAYDELYFKYKKSEFKSEENALYYLIDTLESEIAYFYNFKVSEIRKSREWLIINDGMHEILDFEDKESKKSLKEKYINRPKLFKEVFKNIGLFKGQEIFNNNINNRDYSSIYKYQDKQVYLKPFIDREISGTTQYPIKETVDLLQYFDQKNSKTFELTVLFIATVMGGIIGATITIVFGT